MLELVNLEKSYDDIVIGPINICLKSNQFISIIGASGAGKTTLVKMITNNILDYRGKVYLDGVELKKELISYITQKTMLFNHLTIEENFALSNVDLSDVDKILGTLNLESNIKYKYPFEISGGQAQRVNFARVLLKKPKLVILDEAFSALDINSKDEIYDLIYKLMKEYELLIISVTHDIVEAVILSDQIILMDQGLVIMQASPQEIILSEHDVVKNLISPKRKKLLEGMFNE